MSRRIEIELTSDRGDGSWTWRAAGAQKPRGVVESTLVPDGAKVGDVLRAETESDIEGVTILSLSSSQTRNRTEPERIEVMGSSRRDEDQLVTTQLVSKSRGDRDRRPRREGDRPRSDRPEGDRRPRGDRPEGERRPRSDRPEGDRRPRRDGDRPQSTERRGPRKPAPPSLPERPKPKRLRPGRVHRKAILADLPAEQQPIAEEVMRGGIPAVRQAIETENEKRAAGGEPPINSPELLKLAESLLPRLRTAEWRDRADAALADADHLDLRDLRSVVVASDAAARDDETREMAGQLRVKLDERVAAEQALWLEDLQLALDAGRIVRALRVSSRPPKAGTMLSPDLRLALTGGANAALAADAGPDRWAAVLDAIAYSPVRTEVAPVSTPESPSDELLAVVRKYASRVPKVAVAFGLDAQPAKRPSGRALRPPKPPRRSGAVPVPARSPDGALGAPVASDAPVADAAATEPAVTDTPATEPAAEVRDAYDDEPAADVIEAAVDEATTADTEAPVDVAGEAAADEAATEETPSEG